MVTARVPLQETPSIEWPTVALAAVIYGGWFGLTAWHAAIPAPLVVVVLTWIIAWHGSLQHELIHGHPTRNPWVNAAFGFVPLSLWLPYAVYAHEHAAHHATPELTDPLADSESNYLPRAGGLAHGLAALQATLAGRIAFGPPIRIAAFWIAQVRRLAHEPTAVLIEWVPHLVACALIVAWLRHAGFDLALYAACIWAGTGLSLIRSYAEHRASPDPAARTAMVLDRGPLALLFLHNNLHAWHHAMPGVAWYDLPALHAQQPDAFPAAPTYSGYGAVFARFFFAPHDRLVHPGA